VQKYLIIFFFFFIFCERNGEESCLVIILRDKYKINPYNWHKLQIVLKINSHLLQKRNVIITSSALQVHNSKAHWERPTCVGSTSMCLEVVVHVSFSLTKYHP
jgi:hypothetical protein